ncbi:ethylbenzene dehydrogenase-related protein [Candidatus Magnetaquicoccus inordinatus]|uniref:ethylbenzene dehydrogenase-related protein n=1 Tax=Candidatus Magnetaquicoccus inordinatus TaxID=2496818 RepID=UPI00187D5B74|nr:ethylbenzene dehydrogenase-related protein [Candidatus Magnetaquicoccus inordinatus]
MKRMFSTGFLAATLSVMVAGAAQAGAQEAAPESLQALRVSGKGPIVDVGGTIWNQAKAVKVAMQPQVVTMPTNPNAAVKEVTVRSVHNGEWLALLLEWQDYTKSDMVVVDGFSDQVAVEFPVTYKADNPPSPMMGNAGNRVNVLQWRASMQRDLDQGREAKIQDFYPNAPDADLYYTNRLSADAGRPYLGAKGLGNPVSVQSVGPVLDMMAEGFSSLTVRSKQEATGKGIYRDGKWHVTITVPMNPVGKSAPKLEAGQGTIVALAVWDGGGQEVGARKSWSDWVSLTLGK